MVTKPIAVLLIEDDPGDAVLIQRHLSNNQNVHYEVTHVDRLSNGLACIQKSGFDVVLLDLGLPDSAAGFGGFETVHAYAPDVPIIVLTGYDNDEFAIEAVEKGAQDYLVKGQVTDVMLGRSIRYAIGRQKLLTQLEHSTQEIEERKGTEKSLRNAYAEIKQLKDRFHAENIYLNQAIDREYNFGEIVGRSNALQYVFFRVEQVAPQDTTVLLLGETGTGKGVIARSIHSRSIRKDRPMITVNCSALPANLIESELFGREKGAFTGSSERQMGRFELADNGTLFLDEVGEMPMELQTKLLRVIQDGEFERLGGPKTIRVNVRIIASTNRNLEEAIRNNTFREDLFYRLNVFPITIPPLRQRKEDIPLLVDYFVAKFNKKTGKKIETVSKDTLKFLQNYNWPGNVRELESIIERSIITSQGIRLQILDRFVNSLKAGEQEAQDCKALVELERDHILQTLEKAGWRIEGEKGAAAMLGLNPSTLRSRMRKNGIRRS